MEPETIRRQVGLAAASAILAAGLWAGGCQNGFVEPPPPPEGKAVISDPVVSPSLTGPAPGARAALSEALVAYVSLPPDSVPGGTSAVVQNRRTGNTTATAVINGGFDPVPVLANAGDTLDLVVSVGEASVVTFSYAVPPRLKPVVVRTSPSSGKRDVPLNTIIVIVFSEPIDAATLTPSSVQLFRGSSAVAGTVSLLQGTATAAVFVPSFSLAANTGYRLVVTQGVTDLQGDALAAETSVEFTTGNSVTLPAILATLAPDTSAIQIGSHVQLTIAARDTSGAPVFGRPITWSSDNPAVATVSSTGLVTAVAEGRADVRGQVDRASGVGVVLVSAALTPVDSVAVSPESATIPVAGPVQLSAVLRDAAGNTLSFRPITWGSNAPGVATVAAGSSGAARVTGVSPGTATITATSEGKSARVAITVVNPGPYATLTAASDRTCGVTTNAWAFCWGANVSTGSNDSVPVGVEGGRRFSQVSPSAFSTCALTPQGAAYCWGVNAFGALGTGSASQGSPTPVPVSGALALGAIAAGAYSHACALTANGAAYCWGRNDQGELGIGTTTGPEFCQNTPCSTVPVAVAGGLTFTTLQVGTAHACALTTNGTAYCWGVNGDGQLGDGTTVSRASPVRVAAGLTFVALSTRFDHTCAVTSSGVAYCWGSNASGQLGVATATGPEVCAQDNTPDACSTLPVAVAGSRTWVAVSPGGQHTCGLTPGGVAYCWGYGGNGQLGNGAIQSTTTPVAVTGGLAFATLGLGSWHSCGVTVAGVAYCWGENFFGKLGNGSTVPSSVPVKVAGQP